MTREEAIEVLENGEWWEELTEWYMVVHPEHNKLHDAVDMAISVLRQQKTVKNRNGLNEPLTNAQKIRAMTDEELAEFIISIPMCVGEDKDLNCEIDVCKECFLKWLQQPAEEDKHD